MFWKKYRIRSHSPDLSQILLKQEKFHRRARCYCIYILAPERMDVKGGAAVLDPRYSGATRASAQQSRLLFGHGSCSDFAADQSIFGNTYHGQIKQIFIGEKDCYGETKIDDNSVYHSIGRLFLGVGDDGLEMLGGYLEDMQVIPGICSMQSQRIAQSMGDRLLAMSRVMQRRLLNMANTSLIQEENKKAHLTVNGKMRLRSIYVRL